MPIEDSDQSAHLHTKSYKLTVCAHRRLRSVCISSHQKLQAGRMRPSKTQISLHIFTPKVTSWPYVPIEDSDQSAHLHTKSYKLAVCAHRRLRSVCTSSHQKLQVGRMCPSKTQISLHIFTPKVTSWPYAPIEDSDQSAHLHSKSYKLTVCAHRRLCTSSQQKLQVDRMRPSKTQISLHIFTPKVTSWPYVPIEDSDQSAHLHTKSYKLTICAHRRLRSVCTSSHQKLQVDHMCPSKTQISLHIFTPKVTSWPYVPIEDSDQSAHLHTKSYKLAVCAHRRLRSVCTSSHQKLQVGRMRPSKTQISLHIFTPKVTSWPYVPIEDSDQSAHLHTKSYKLAVCAHRRLRSVCTSSHQKLQIDRMRPSKTQISLHIFTPKVTSWPYAPIEDSDQSAHLHTKSYKLTVCDHRRLRSVCTS